MSTLEPDAVASRRLWAAMMLARNVETCDSILRGRPVLVDNLDPTALGRALRGRALAPGAYLELTGEHLDAVAEEGPFA